MLQIRAFGKRVRRRRLWIYFEGKNYRIYGLNGVLQKVTKAHDQATKTLELLLTKPGKTMAKQD